MRRLAKGGRHAAGDGGKGAEASCTAELEFVFDSQSEAEKVDRATRQDNEGYVETAVVGNRLTATVRAGSVSSLLHTIDDFLECVSVSERIISEEGIKRKKGKRAKGK